MSLSRRRFVQGMSATAVPARYTLFPRSGTTTPVGKPSFTLQRFDFNEVHLLAGPLAEQYDRTRDFYFGVNNDDIVKGFREYAGMAAPGKELGGWCSRDASEVFGQWLSGMSRMYRGNADTEMKNKAMLLMTEWGKTLRGGAGSGIAYFTERKGHYLYDKNVGGLTDMALYSGAAEAWPLLSEITDWAEKNLSRQRRLANSEQRQANFDGHSMEWYTLSENLYRAWQASGDARYKDFGDLWRYDQYWSKFYETAYPQDAYGVHAYSHLNAFNSAAMSYVAAQDVRYLEAAKNAFTYFVNTQCFATGGYGPAETLMADGELGCSLEWRSDSAECPCGAWGGFKLSQYLTTLTGQAQYGDWAERLLYNVTLATLPMSGNGNTFYYADYRVGGGMKTYRWDTWPCCSGTYIQNVASYANFIYYKNNSGLFVNLFVPSDVVWNSLHIRQETVYPQSEEITFRIRVTAISVSFLHFRIPAWCDGASLKLNGRALNIECRPGTWASVNRAWKDGDTLVLRLPMKLQMTAVDKQHPNRAAISYGPVVLAQDARVHERFVPSRDADQLARTLVRGDRPLEFVSKVGKQNRFRPFYLFEEFVPYWMYFDV